MHAAPMIGYGAVTKGGRSRYNGDGVNRSSLESCVDCMACVIVWPAYQHYHTYVKGRFQSLGCTYHLLILLLIAPQATCHALVETRFPLCLFLAEVTHVAQPFSTARVYARILR